MRDAQTWSSERAGRALRREVGDDLEFAISSTVRGELCDFVCCKADY